MLDHHYSGDKEFVANFMLSMIMAMLRAIMFQLSKLRRMVGSGRHDREESIRPMFSPLCVHLLSALNVLRRSCRTSIDLCNETLMMERTRSLLGSILEERDKLLKRCYDKCRLMRDERGAPSDQKADERYAFNPHAVVYQMRKAGGENENAHCGRINSFQSRLYVFQVLVDAYKYLSIDVHHWLGRTCPTCHPAHLMKQELQTMVESVREALPIVDRDVMFEPTNADPINIENVHCGSCVRFVEEERELSDEQLEAEFQMHSEIHKLATDCDLVAKGLRVYKGHKNKQFTQQVRSTNFQMNNRLPTMVTFVHGASDAHHQHNLESLRIREDLEDTLNDDSAWSHVGALKREDNHYTPMVGYYPFKLSYWTDNECCKIASSFTSIRDDVRYQGCEKSGTYVKDVMFTKARQRALVRLERMNRYHPLPNNFVRQRVAEPVARCLPFNDDVNDDQEI